MQIGNNTASFNTWKNYTNNVNSLRKSMSKLSSGSRINNAGDDPSGLAMSERLRTQSRNTAAASGNVENKLNYLQTADSWMQKMHDMLGRMGELAVMANDGTKSDTDKAVLQNEFSQMQQEIKRITGTGAYTAADLSAGGDANAAGKFNGIALFQAYGQDLSDTDEVTGDVDGVLDTFQGVTQQVGADGGQTFTGVGLDLTATNNERLVFENDGVGTSDYVVTWGSLIDGTVKIHADTPPTDVAGTTGTDESDLAGNAVGAVNAGIDFLSSKRSQIGAEMKRMEQTLDGLRSYEENITATQSRIRDVDVAKETAEMSKFNILQQVGTAMMAQANQLPQGVLQLVG